MTESFSFNLLDEPWIPCLWRDGAPVELSLRETLVQSHTLQMVTANAPQTTVALMRLLLAVLHRVFGPTDEDAWAALWTAPNFDTAVLDAYFDQWRHRFDLFDAERPFYQMNDPRKQFKPIAALKHGFDFWHDLHFDHDGPNSGLTMYPAQAARAVVTVQAFGFGGTSGIDQKHTDAPCAKGVIFLVYGDSLKETLLLNMPAYPRKMFFVRFQEDDAPTWEQVAPYDDERIYPYGLLDYLTWPNRRILLKPNFDSLGNVAVHACKVGPGLRMVIDVPNPLKIYFRSEKTGLSPLLFREDQGLWRDSASLFARTDSTAASVVQSPAAFDWLRTILEEFEDTPILSAAKTYQCMALGVQKDQGKILYTRQETIPVLPDYLRKPDLVEQLADALSYTRSVEFSLQRAARVAGIHLHAALPDEIAWKRWQINPPKGRAINKTAAKEIDDWVQHTGVERAYWAGLDVPFQAFVVRLPAVREKTVVDWQHQLEEAAYAAFDAIGLYTPDDGRSLKALVRGRQALSFSLRKSLPLLYAEDSEKDRDTEEVEMADEDQASEEEIV